MKKNTNTKKKIYLVDLPDDMGELWLDENKQPLSWIHCNDANWRGEYQNFIIEYLGGELVDLYLSMTDADDDLLYEADCKEMIWEVVKKYIK